MSTPTTPLSNAANQLTALRLLLSIVLFVFIEFRWWWACSAVFLIAAVTDWLDGYVARKHNLASAFGRMFDPLADKVIVCGAFILLLDDIGQVLRPWMVVLIVAREFIVTGIRGLMEQMNVAFGADVFGKLKMVLQCVFLVATFAALALADGEVVTLRPESTEQLISLLVVVSLHILVWMAVLATALSGLQYLWKAAAALRRE